MSILGLLFLAFIIFFIIIPLVRVLTALSRARHQVRDIFGAMNGGAGSRSGQQRSEHRTRRPEPQPRQRRKKIDPTVGEYVDFEEVSCTVTKEGNNGTTTKYKTESQIEDITWEEL